MTQSYPILVIEGDVDDDGNDETGIFEMPDAEVTATSLVEFLAQFGGGGGPVGALTAQVGQKGSQIAIDGGSGPRTFEMQFEGWTDSDDYQFGDSASAGVSETSATGGDRISQVSVLNEYLNKIDIGSNNPATLYWGEYSDSSLGPADGGVYDPVDVAIPESSLTVPIADEASTYQGSMTCVAVDDLSNIIDGASRTG